MLRVYTRVLVRGSDAGVLQRLSCHSQFSVPLVGVVTATFTYSRVTSSGKTRLWTSKGASVDQDEIAGQEGVAFDKMSRALKRDALGLRDVRAVEFDVILDNEEVDEWIASRLYSGLKE